MIIREKTIGEIFRISLWLKGAHSLLEILGGLALLLVSHAAILHFVGWITHGELLHDPQDLLARNLEQWATGFSSGSQSFAAWYLLSHGAIKLVLVAAVLRNKSWAYPVFIAAMIGFIAYQVYRLSHQVTLLMAAITILDVIVLVLAWHEFRLLRRRSHSGADSMLESIPATSSRLIGWSLGKLREIDSWFAILIAAFASLLFGFVKLAGEVIEGDTRGFDETIMLALRTPGDISQPLGPVWFHELVRDFTAIGSTGVLTIVTLGVAGFLAFSRKGHTALFVLLAVIGGVILSNVLKTGFSRPRPELVPHSVVVFTNSFPSGHAMMSAVVYLTLGNLLARTQKQFSIKIFLMALAAFLTVLVGVSRVYLGVHWPSDVLAGWTLGACWALLCWFLMLYLQQRGKVEPESAGNPTEERIDSSI